MKHEDELSSGSTASVASLDGIKVLELGPLSAGPFSGKTLADFGADVIKAGPPARDRQHGGSTAALARAGRPARTKSRPDLIACQRRWPDRSVSRQTWL
jgi:hypothetical protein